MKKLSRKGAIRKLDSLCRDIIWYRDKNKCRKCCKPMERGYGDVHHIVPKKRGYHVRWELNNLILLCPGCHFWFHKDPFAIDWLRDVDPDIVDVISELNRQQTQSYKQQDLIDLITTLEKVKELTCI